MKLFWLSGDASRSNVRSVLALGVSLALVYGVLAFVFLWVIAPSSEPIDAISIVRIPKAFDVGYPMGDLIVSVTSSSTSTMGLGVAGISVTVRFTRLDPVKVGSRVVYCSNATLFSFDTMFTHADWVFCRSFVFTATTGVDGIARFHNITIPFAVAGRYFVAATLGYRSWSDGVVTGTTISALHRYYQILPVANQTWNARRSPVGDARNRVVVGRVCPDFEVRVMLITTRNTCPVSWTIALVPLTTSAFGFGSSQLTTDYIADGLVDADGFIQNNISEPCTCEIASSRNAYYAMNIFNASNSTTRASASFQYNLRCRFSNVAVLSVNAKRIRIAAFSGSESLWLDPFPEQWRMPVVSSVARVQVTATSLTSYMAAGRLQPSPILPNRSGVEILENSNFSISVRLIDAQGAPVNTGKLVFAIVSPSVDNPSISGLDAFAHPLYSPKKALRNVAVVQPGGIAVFPSVQLSLAGGVGFYSLRVVCDGVYEGAWFVNGVFVDEALLFVKTSVSAVVIHDPKPGDTVVVGEYWASTPSFLLTASDGSPVPRKLVVLRSRSPDVVVAHSTTVTSDAAGLFAARNISITACASCSFAREHLVHLDVVVDGVVFGSLSRVATVSIGAVAECGAVVATQFPKVLWWDMVVFRVLPKVNQSMEASNVVPPYCFVTNNDGSFVQASLSPVTQGSINLFMLALSPAYAWLAHYFFFCRCGKNAADAQAALSATKSDFRSSDVVPLILPTYPPFVFSMSWNETQASMNYNVSIPASLFVPSVAATLVGALQSVAVK